MERFTVGAVQTKPHFEDLERNLESHFRFVGEAAAAGCRLVAFPEVSVNSFNSTQAITRFAQSDDGPIARALHECARAHDMVVGYGFVEDARGTFLNAYSLVGPDGLIGKQRKLHLSHDEYFCFSTGNDLPVFDLGFAKVGTAICADASFPESWRILALREADVVLAPCAIRKMNRGGVSGPLTFDGHDYEATDDEMRAQQAFLFEQDPKMHTAFAKMNGVYAAFSDQVGFDGHSSHVGGAGVISPWGEWIARNEPTTDEVMVTCELDPELIMQTRQSPWHQLKLRRPDAYGELVTRA